MTEPYHKKHYRENRETYLEKARQYAKLHPDAHKKNALRVKKIVIEYYTKGKMCCNCCGESIFEFLSMDHINGGGTQHRRQLNGGNNIYRWLRKNNFPDGFQVLCYNCNCGREKTPDKVCPHKRV